MIINFSLARLTLIFLLVVLFPLVQNQWLNLYLFNINNFTIYKTLYFFSGLICPILVCINSLNIFTYYKFSIKKNTQITGLSLLLTTVTVLISLSTIIFSYFFINLKIFLYLFISDNKYFLNYDIEKVIFFVVILSIFLIFKKIKFIIKKIVLLNFIMISVLIWYIKINNIIFDNSIIFKNIFKFENINFINLIFLLSAEILFYLWSYISYESYLSDWSVPILHKNQIIPILKIVIFYLFIFLYYSILYN